MKKSMTFSIDVELMEHIKANYSDANVSKEVNEFLKEKYSYGETNPSALRRRKIAQEIWQLNKQREKLEEQCSEKGRFIQFLKGEDKKLKNVKQKTSAKS